MLLGLLHVLGSFVYVSVIGLGPKNLLDCHEDDSLVVPVAKTSDGDCESESERERSSLEERRET